MRFFSYLRVEIGRIFRSKTTWLIFALTILSPLMGYGLYQPAGSTTTAAMSLANPVLAGGLVGAVLFALLTLFEFDRVKKNQTDALTDSITSLLELGVAKLIALLTSALTVVLITAVLNLPYTIYRMDTMFDLTDYCKSFLILMLPSLLFAIIISSALYQIFRRVDLSFLLFVAFAYFSLSKWSSDEYLLRWINPLTPTFSSDFSNEVVFRTAGYSRMVWFALLIGVWLISLLCVRNHGKGLFGSLIYNARRAYIPVIAVLSIVVGCHLYLSEPFIDHSPILRAETGGETGGGMSYSTYGGEETENQALKLSDTKMDITLDTRKTRLDGKAVYQLQNTSGQPQECRMEINPGHTIQKMTVNGLEIDFTDQQNDHDVNAKDVVFELPADKELTLEVEYGGSPKIWSSLRMVLRGTVIDPKYIEVNGNALVPTLTDIPSEESGLSGTITLPGNLELISIGTPPTVLRENSDGTRTWQVHDPYGRASLFAGNYVKLKIDGGRIPTYFYYSKRHQAQLEELGIQQILEDTIAYCTKRFGPLPYTEDMPLAIIMSNAYTFGGGATGNLSFMDESTYAKESLNDPQKGANAAEVLAHEIIHQWWGIGRYVMDMENGDWSSEGFTVYTTYRMMKKKYGDEYAQKYYVDVWTQALKNQKNNFYVRHPEYMELLPEKYVAELQSIMWNAKVYNKVPLQILEAEKLVGGEEKLDEILTNLYQSGGTELSPLIITWHDFLNACGLTEEEINID